MKVEEWFEKNRYKCDSFKNIKRLVELKKKKKKTISVVIPTLNEEGSVGKVINVIKDSLFDKYKLIDEIIVIDSGSTDNTKEVVEKNGIKFICSKDILKKYKWHKGKGENLWKALYVTKGDIIVYIDADIDNIHPRFVYGLVGPLLTNDKIGYTKGFYKRPIKSGKEIQPLGGGRTTELTVRPLLNMFFPRLSGFIQPLSGEYAARRSILEKIPFFTGYGVETAMLIDITKKFGLKKIAQVDLKRRVHRNQTLAGLSNQAFGILGVFSKRANTLGKFILVKEIRDMYRIIERSNNNGLIEYKLITKRIEDKQRPPIISLAEYRKKFKKDPSWLYI